jgi:septum site-determining protein MinC
MSNERITIKGTSNGLTINIGSGVWQGLLEELNNSLTEKASFFKGGRVALNVGPRQLTRQQIEAVGTILDHHAVTLWAIESDAAGTQQSAAQLGLETSLFPRQKADLAPPPPEPMGDSIVIRRTLRSGQLIDHPGNVVIIGDVNPGAEITAGGSVIVWGRLRGNVFAGADEGFGKKAVVCALQLSPMRLRIGNYVARAPAEDGNQEIIPEMACIQDEQIVATPWNG